MPLHCVRKPIIDDVLYFHPSWIAYIYVNYQLDCVWWGERPERNIISILEISTWPVIVNILNTMHDENRKRWDERHAKADGEVKPTEVLLRNRYLLPQNGKALDLACGRGGNALELSRAGLETHAWDFSPIAIERLQQEAEKQGLTIRGEVRDVVSNPPEPESFDLIIVTHFLERDLFPHLPAALRPGGLLFYQTFIQEIRLDRGPKCTEWRLDNNELLHAFSDLRVHYYREEGLLGKEKSSIADIAMLVASKT